MKILLVAGPSQSGSTLLFNMLRILLQMSKHKVDSCWYTLYKEGIYDENADYLIVKCHYFDEELCNDSSYIFLPLRDFRDSALSTNKRYNNLNNEMDFENFIIQEIDQYESWSLYADYVFKYEEYIKDKINHIFEIIYVLNLNENNINITLLLKELDDLHNGKNCPSTDILPNEDYNTLMKDELYKKTLMTKSHNTSNGKIYKYKTDMSKELIDHLNKNKRIRNFLTDHGYE